MNIGIAISGGDGSGINNFVYSMCSLLKKDKIYLFKGGLIGLLSNDFSVVSSEDALDFSLSDFPFVRSARTDKILNYDDIEKISSNLIKNNIDTFILCGGDGSLRFLSSLIDKNIKCYGIPMTIDNDIEGTDYSIGHPSAVEVIKDDVKRIRNSARALPNRVFILEVLGGYCGYLSLNAALVANADFALIPEVPVDFEKIASKITHTLKFQNSFIIICSEGCLQNYKPGYQGIVPEISKKLESITGIRVRQTILGYGQRNGIPNTEELYKSQKLAYYLKSAIEENIYNVLVGLKCNLEVSYLSLKDVKTRNLDMEHINVKMALMKGII